MDLLTDYVIAPLLNTLSYPLTSYPLRYYLFGTQDGKDVRLPPVVGGGDIVAQMRKHGVWGRHVIDQNMVKTHGHIYCMIPPPAMGGGLVKLVVNISDPNLVQQVLEDFVAYPTRGKTGLSDTVRQYHLSWSVHQSFNCSSTLSTLLVYALDVFIRATLCL